jgi:hypothetical protein
MVLSFTLIARTGRVPLQNQREAVCGCTPCSLAHWVTFASTWHHSNECSLCMAHMLGSCSQPSWAGIRRAVGGAA